MKTRRIILLTIFIISLLSISPKISIEAQNTPFLISPYYGSATRTAYFDHEYPLSTNGIMTRYDGMRWTSQVGLFDCVVTPGNYDRCYDGHEGTDFSTDHNPIVASANGYITRADWDDADRDTGYGLVIEIQHENGYLTRYGHLSSIIANVGDYVQAGQIIGSSGDTGNATGAHLHFGVLNSIDNLVDPFGWSGTGNDPWQTATSWCMWKQGQWATICDATQDSSLNMQPPAGTFYSLVDDNTTNSNGFAKGRGTPSALPCPPYSCPAWSSATGWGGDAFRTPATTTNNDYWASWQPQNVPPGGALYRIEVYVPDLTDGKTWRATYHIAHWLGQSTVIVDQEGLDNRWVTIGYYVMRSGNFVYVDSATGEPTQGRAVMADALAFTSLDATYLPHYQQGTNFNSSLLVQNTSGPGFAYTVFFNSNGAVLCSSHGYIFANQISTGGSCPGASSAIVYSTQESAVVLRRQATSGTLNLDNGFWDIAGADPTFEQKGAYLYVPSFYNNIFSNWNSTLYLMNVGSIATGVDILFKGRVGYGDTTISIANLPANGTYQIPSSNAWGTTSWVGSVVIISNNMHVVAQVIDSNATLGTNRSANTADQGRTVLYWPDAYKNMWNKTSGLVIQNTAMSSNANATLYFYDRDGTPRGSYTLTNIGPERAVGLSLDSSVLNSILPSSWTGAVRIESTQLIAGIAQTKNGEALRSTNLVYQTSQFFYLPRIARNDGGSNTGYIIHNPSDYPISVTARYYYLTGAPVPAATITFSIPAYGTVGRSQNIDPLGTTWVGSVILSASGPIVAVAEEISGSSINAGYNGMLR